MPTIRSTITVQATVEQAWTVLGDLGAVDRWIPGVTACRLDGPRRICNGGEIEEEISDYSPQTHSYRYRHLKIPLPVRSSSGRLAAFETDRGTIIEWVADIQWIDPAQEREMTAMLEGINRAVLESLRRRIEDQVGVMPGGV